MLYQRRKGALDSVWHFHSECPKWPALGSVEIRFVPPGQSDNICIECIRLDERCGSGVRPKRNNDFASG